MKVRVATEMFAHVAPGLSFDDRSLTLLDVAPSTIWLQSGHARALTHLTTGAFLDRWADRERALGPQVPVTGYLALLDPDAQLAGRAVLELRHPHITAAGLSYDARVVEGIVPRSSGACVLFLHQSAPPIWGHVSYGTTSPATEARAMSQPDEVSPAAKDYGSRPMPFRAKSRSTSPWRFVPLVQSLRGYTTTNLRVDVIAGVALAALAVPQGMAYAQTAGLPVVAGLYGLLLPLAAYAALGSSRSLMTGPTATAALLVAPALATVTSDPAAYPALAAMLALLVGAVFLVARLLRLGWISDYFSAAVLLGFLSGLALTLVSGQLDDFTGVDVQGDTPLQEYISFAANFFGGTHGLTLLIGVLCLAALLIGGRFLPKFPMLLLVTVLAIGASALWDFGDQGVKLVGAIPPGLPSLTWPAVSLSDIALLVPSAVGIALVGFSDAILTARSLEQPDAPAVDTNQELIALAGINLAAGVSQSMPLGSSGSRSAVNIRLGGRTQVVGLVQAGGVALVLLFLTEALALLPKATLGAVIIYAALGLMDFGAWRAFARGSRGELLVAAITVVGMLTIGLLGALVLAVLLSILDVIRRSAQPRDAVLGWSAKAGRFVDVERHPEATVIPGLVIYRMDDRLFFANCRYFRGRVRDAIRGAPYPVTALVFDAESVTDLDTSGAQALADLVTQLRGEGIRFVLARSRATFEAQLSRTGQDDALAPQDRYPTVRAAVTAVTGVDLATLPTGTPPQEPRRVR